MLNHYTTKMTGPLEIWIIYLSFLHFYTVIQGVYPSLYCQNPYSHIKCLFTEIQSDIAIWQYIAMHLNTIRNMALTRIVSLLSQHCSYKVGCGVRKHACIMELKNSCLGLWMNSIGLLVM